MEPNVRVIPNGEKSGSGDALEKFERIAKLLDSRFVIPGTSIRFGVDPLLSFIPLVGDVITFVIASILIYTVYVRGASRKVVILMMLNAGFDTIIGAIPLLGTVLDVFYRSNERNLRLLKEHYFEGKHQGSGTGLLVLIVAIALLLVAVTVFGIWKLADAIFSA
jgi:hypothetical protein